MGNEPLQPSLSLGEMCVILSPSPLFPLLRQEIEAYIRAKYVDKRFVRKQSAEEQRSKVIALSKKEKRLSSSTEHLPPRPPPPTPRLRPASKVSPASGETHFRVVLALVDATFPIRGIAAR